MSLSLDDLGRAAWDAEWRAVLAKDAALPPLEDVDKPTANAGALAAVERFAEALVDDVLYFDELHPKEKIRQLLASLRAEAGQNTNAAQPQKE